ncbi:MAG: long-chain-acyl-CoA synthetase [Rhodocyclaceae bacterium]|nr:long-chain-acyl-CoA synthetase [Rhodocyclaceae bacterium]
MSTSEDKISLRDIGRASLRLLPGVLDAVCGAVRLGLVQAHARRSIGLLLEQQALSNPDKDCLRFEGRRWSYRDFNAWANRIADVLHQRGIRRGDSVGVLFDNEPALLACVAAIVKLGAVAGMLNPNQRGEVLAYSVGVIKPKTLLISEACLPALRSAFAEQPADADWLWVGEGEAPPGLPSLPALAERANTANPAITREIEAREACYYIFTSGTTGLPKAARMSHLRWLRSAYGMGQLAMRLHADDVFYCPLPFYHNNALTLCWSSVLAAGATLAMAQKFSASRFWDDIRHHEATAFVYIGELCRYLLLQAPKKSDREHRVRVAIGNGLRPEIWDEFQQRFGIEHLCEFYGSSEGNLVFVNVFGLARTAGFSPLPYAIVGFDTENDCPQRNAKGFMQRVATGEAGLLISEVSKHNPFDGYTDEKASEAKLFRNVFKQGDCWINSGDLVREQGMRHIAFVDRVGDTFRWKGENVATTEVERAVGALPGVELASVYGVQVPHADGRAGMAAIVLQAGARFDGISAAKALLQALPAYAVPVFVRLLDAHETTATFKIRKVDLKQQGFDPASVDGPLFVLRDRALGYEPMTAATLARINDGQLRL